MTPDDYYDYYVERTLVQRITLLMDEAYNVNFTISTTADVETTPRRTRWDTHIH